MKSSSQLSILFAIFATLFLFACTTQAKKTEPVILVGTTPEPPKEFDTEFTLKTAAENGKLLYIGVGGEIDGVINPDLIIKPGDVVHLILVNGDGMPHDFYQPDLDIKTDYVVKIGDEKEIIFEVNDLQPSNYVYYCTVPGHRQAGQEGKLIVENFEQ